MMGEADLGDESKRDIWFRIPQSAGSVIGDHLGRPPGVAAKIEDLRRMCMDSIEVACKLLCGNARFREAWRALLT